MRFSTFVTGLTFLFLTASLGLSQTAVIESFDYASGTPLDGLGTVGNGWIGAWTDFVVSSASFAIADTGLSYGDMNYDVPDAGRHVTGLTTAAWSTNRWGRYLDQTWTDAAGKVYWFSAIMELKKWGFSNSWAGAIGVWLDDTEGPLLGKGWGGTVFSYGSGDPGETEETGYAWDIGPVWLVARMDMSGDTTAEKLHMWVNPDPMGGEPDTTMADTRSTRDVNNGFNRIVVHFGGEGVGMQISVDELRLGTSWADVSSEITSNVRVQQTAPEDFMLSQNYPNPFNPATRIAYNLKSTGEVRLSVFDVVGREVAVLVNDIQNAGSHAIDFSGTGMSSGLYFYRLQTAGQIFVKKMVLTQ